MMWPFNKQPKITEEDILKIRKADWDTCVKWWDALNSWEWPEELLPVESSTIKWSDTNRRHLLMKEIDYKVGEKYILMKLNTEKKGMTVEEFEDFWNGIHNYDAAAYKRYQDRFFEKHKRETA